MQNRDMAKIWFIRSLPVCLVVSLWLAGRSPAWGQAYSLQGAAVATGGDCYRITDDVEGQNGTIWYKKKISIQTSFDLEFSLNFGENDQSGADGMVFVLQTRGNDAIGEVGQGIGFKGFSPSLGIEFDSYRNLDENDPVYDHIAVVRDGVVNHQSSSNLAGPVPASAKNDNIEDGTEHLVRISWIAPLATLEVYFDCEKRISMHVDMASIFGGQKEVFWGFTGATGDFANRQVVCLKKDIVAQDTFQICRGESLQLVARNSLDGNYTWNPASALDNATTRNPTTRPTQDQLFVVDYQDFCNQPTRDSIFVAVRPLPTLELGPDRAVCSDKPFLLRPLAPDSTAVVRYQWDTGDTTRTILLDRSGRYVLTIRQGDCSSRDSVNITIDEFPRLPAAYEPPLLCLRDETLEIASVATGDGLTYRWSHSTETQQRILIDKKGSYQVTVTTRAGCQITENITVDDGCSLPLWVPDAFSPNADGHNDRLLAYASQTVELRFWVYDRWGKVIFFSNQSDVGWDGDYGGTRCLPGAYSWKAEYRASGRPEAKLFQKTGVVWLVR